MSSDQNSGLLPNIIIHQNPHAFQGFSLDEHTSSSAQSINNVMDCLFTSTSSTMNPDQEPETSNKHKWQTAKKRKRSPTQTPSPPPTPTSNRFSPLQSLQTTSPSDNNGDKDKRENKAPTPPPIFVYDVADYKAMITTFASIIDKDSFHTRVLANDKIKISTHSLDSYRKLLFEE